MILCTACQFPLPTPADIFGDPDAPLCLDCHSMIIHDNGIDFYLEHKRISHIQADFGRGCPHCHCAMEVGVADWTVNTKCPNCGYEETHLLYNPADEDRLWMDE